MKLRAMFKVLRLYHRSKKIMNTIGSRYAKAVKTVIMRPIRMPSHRYAMNPK